METMAKNQKTYTEEFKREAVGLVETSGKSVAQMARDLGVNDSVLHRWRGVYGSGDHPPANGGAGSVSELEAEVKGLRRELEVVKQERDILKKAIHIVSRSQP
jgi:transposase